MSQISNYLETALLNATLRGVPYTSPATVYMALYSTDPTDADAGTEISGGGYVRQAAPFGAPATGTGLAPNSADIAFPVATAAYSAPVSHFGIRDAASGGNLLYYGSISGAAVTITQNGQIKFLAGQLQVTLS